jgi:ABC-type antimicrobial peptide transport system permease subunit
MNPLHWSRGHQWAGLCVSLTGALLGLLMGFFHSSGFSLLGSSQSFTGWWTTPPPHWSWPVVGFFATAVIFYAAQLLHRSN